MKIFGISLVTLILIVAAYWAGTKGMLGSITSKVAG